MAMSQDLISRPVSSTPAEVRTSAEAALRASGYAALALDHCDERDGEVVLKGNVPSYYLKQLAQSFVQRVVGAARVENRIAVRGFREARRASP
jgi:osmotically-inducible protein OsmY